MKSEALILDINDGCLTENWFHQFVVVTDMKYIMDNMLVDWTMFAYHEVIFKSKKLKNEFTCLCLNVFVGACVCFYDFVIHLI